MTEALAAYQELIDALVARKRCVLAERVASGDMWPPGAALAEFNELLASLSPEQRAAVAKLLAQARQGGIHDTLVVLSEKMNLQGMRLVQDGEVLPHEPYGTEIYFDWVSRCEGAPWPHGG